MPYPHVIRLRGPWQYTPLIRFGEGPLPAPGRVELPTDWGATLGEKFRGRVRYERSFNSPSNLDPHERVWLIVDGADARADVHLNGQSLGTIEGYALSAEWDITEIIGSRNLLGLDVEQPNTDSAPASSAWPPRPGREALPGGPIGQVRLEIRSTAFVADFALWIAVERNGSRLLCSGKIRGDGEAGPLSLVISALEREILYEYVTLEQPFKYAAYAGDIPVWAAGGPTRLAKVEVKLISGGEAIWRQELETAASDVLSECIEQFAIGATFVSGGVEAQIEQLLIDVAQEEPAVVMPQILPAPLYERFDRAGVAVIQAMPLEWAEHVCPRLAQHPSIGAWLLTLHEANGQTALPSSTFGRPWVSIG
ncbi:MAG TPA: hypothetical protein VJ783_27410 [Pirellulales bacterium]|nr:hypothetical protein [Pirellulales bacterium]